MRVQPAPDRLIARLAARQGGVVSHEQLVALGLSPDAIRYRVLVGRLHQVHRGVYAVGHAAVGVDGRRWAAVLALGDQAFLSHASAADALGLRATSPAGLGTSSGRCGSHSGRISRDSSR